MTDARGSKRRLATDGIPSHVDPSGEISASILIGQHIDILDGRLEKLEAAVIGYTTQVARQQEALDGFLMPGVKSLLAFADSAGKSQVRTDLQLARSEELLRSIGETLKDVSTRLGQLEATVNRLALGHANLTEKVAAIETKVETLAQRVEKIERRHDDTSLVTKTETEQRKRWLTAGRAALAMGFTAAGWLAAHLPGWLG